MTELFGATLDPADPDIETETFDLDGDGKISMAEEAKARMGLFDASLRSAPRRAASPARSPAPSTS